MHRSSIVLLLFALGCAALKPAAAAELPTAQALRAKVVIAMGQLPESRYERVRSQSFGVAGMTTSVFAGKDSRETDGYGPLQTAHGVYHNEAWHQNANGQTVIEQPDPGKAVEDRYETTVERVSAPFDAYVISRSNMAGSSFKDYIDPMTYRIIRREQIAPTQTTVTTYDDFRTVSGYTMPWHWTRRDGHPENDGEYWVEAFKARAIDAAEIRVAPPRRLLVEFPQGKTSVVLPVQLVRDKFIVRVDIGGRGLDFELDSGDSGITLAQDVAKQLELTSINRFSNPMNAGRFNSTTVLVPQMRIGELNMHDVAVTTVANLFEEDAGVKVVGLLGFDFIAELQLQLDYEHGRVTAVRSDEPLGVSDPRAIALDIRLDMQVPFIDVAINDSVGERFTLDTGGGGTLMITDYFARRYPKALVDRGGGAGRNLQFTGVGGAIDIRPYRLAKVTIGAVTFADFVGYRVVERKSYAYKTDGFIGTELLRYFTVYLDYADSKIVLVPNSEARRAMH